MSIITYPLDGVTYSAEDVATYLCTRTSGVYAKDSNFAVSITGTRQITIAPGLAWINYDDFKGVSVCSREDTVLTVPDADKSVVILTQGLNKIIEINEEDLFAIVEPGVVTAQFAAAVASKGLFYPPDPGSQAVSTIGGNIAENAGGLRGLKYGVTKDYVMGLEFYDHTGELVKSETLGVWKTHDGCDILCPLGTDVKSMSAGTVTEIREDPLWGVMVVVEQDNGLTVEYCGLAKELSVKTGQEIQEGAVIGKTSDTCQAEIVQQPHLHLGVKQGGKWIDPMSVITGKQE